MEGSPYTLLTINSGPSPAPPITNPYTFPRIAPGALIEPFDTTQKIYAPFTDDGDQSIVPQKVLDLLRPSLWTVEIYEGATQLYTVDLESGEEDNEGTIGGVQWTDSLWYGVTTSQSGMITVIKTISGIGGYEPITFRLAIAQPSRRYDAVSGEYWLFQFEHSAIEASPGSLSDTFPVVYDGTTYFSGGSTDFQFVLTRSEIP